MKIKFQQFLKISIFIIATILLSGIISTINAQRKNSKLKISYNENLYDAIKWRSIGPFRGGRSAAVTGVAGKPDLYYFGSTGGGVWRSEDSGGSWGNISDGYFGGSIGAVSVSESDNNVIYVGGGEKTVRGNVSYGYGLWKSVDAGKTWKESGLKESKHISRIRIHPANPDIIYVAVMGDLYKDSKQRGVYKSINGGKNWKQVLFTNEIAGAVDLVFDPANPRILYASTWKIRRTPYSLSSGGEGSGLWKSTDEGESWEKISSNNGFPEGPLGIIGVTVSPANPERVWAIVEAKNGGVFRSDNGGSSWLKLNDNRSLRQRAWYYSRIYAHTKDQDIVYVLNVNYHKSTDGGKTFKSYNAPHGDHHDLWIAPENPERMIIGDDGGAQISKNGGESWSPYNNQPTAQFYRVVTDNHFPYRIYGAQQDNSTVRILHRTDGGSIGENDWESTAGGESAHIAIDPLDNDIVFGGSYGGYLTWKDHKNKQSRSINVWPDNPMGHGAEGMKYRFQWNFPIFYSPHNPKKLYAASNHLHVSYDAGDSWKIISPDLTRNDAKKLVSSGGPITKDNTGVEYYCTIFAAVESAYEENLIWTGSDDGLIHISQDSGENWKNVTPEEMPEWMMINCIDPDPFTPGGAYIAGTLYKSGNYEPYLYKTKDYGKSWTKITEGIDPAHFTRVIRADPDRKGLLYAGTENGMYISFDDGNSWKTFQLNLPIVPITDLTIKNKNLIAATQGRSFWMIDDLSPLHQLNDEIKNSDFHLYKPIDAWRIGSVSGSRLPRGAGQNHPGGVMIYFYLEEEPDSTSTISLEFMEKDGDLINKYTSNSSEKGQKLEIKKGMNLFVWNMIYPDAEGFEGMILWGGQLSGPKAKPGNYTVKLSVEDKFLQQTFNIMADPRSSAIQEDYNNQFDFLISIRDKLTESHKVIKEIRSIRKQLESWKSKISEKEDMDKLVKLMDNTINESGSIEKALYQTKNKSRQDPLNYPIKLTNKLAHLASLSSNGNNSPTHQAYNFKKEVCSKIDEQLKLWNNIKNNLLPEINKQIRENNIDAVIIK
ncbi:WD40/YVTN/BNR-like repeat-containing protein [Bacteroidota bacterium]